MKSITNPVYSIKPIETYYNGIFYRSRLEARWAFFFDCLEIKHFYEHEGFAIKVNGKNFNYLPDFYIPKQEYPIPVKQDMYFEIKPSRELSSEEENKLDAFSTAMSATGAKIGVLREVPKDGFSLSDNFVYEKFMVFSEGQDCYYRICLCPFCWAFGYEFEGKWDRIICECGVAKQKVNPSFESFSMTEKMLLSACRSAAGARFGR